MMAFHRKHGMTSAMALALQVLCWCGVAMGASNGYYAGTTSEGLGIGFHVTSNVEDSLLVKFKLYNTSGTYLKDTVVPEGRNASIVSNYFSNEPGWDTISYGSGSPIFTCDGTFNYFKLIYLNTTGGFSWTNNYLSGDSRLRKSAEDLTYTAHYLGTTIPGSAPSGVTATSQSSSSILLSWSTTTGATRYLVYRATSYSGTYYAWAYTTTNSYTNTGLSANTAYYYKVRAENIWGWTDYSSIAYTTTAPTAPTGVSASALSSSSAGVTWSSVTGATSYKVYVSSSSGGTYTLAGTATTTADTITSLGAATTYYFKVSAVNSAGSESSQSSYAYATTSPAAPTGLSATALSSSSIRISWTASTGASAYYLYRSTSSGSGYTYIGGTASTQYDNSSLASGTTYYYKIRAYNGTYSDSAGPVSTITIPGIPSGLSAAVSVSGDIELSWSISTGADSYIVYRASSAGGTYSPIDTVNSASATDTSVGDGETWYYRVAAGNSSGASSTSSFASATVPPAAPGSVSSTALSATSIRASWGSVSGATSYTVYRSADSSSGFVSVGSTSNTYYDNTSLSSATEYYYRVTASNAGGESALSAYTSATTLCSTPAAPDPAAASTSSISLTWFSVTGATAYSVYRATSAAGSYSYLGQTALTTYTSSGLSAGTWYHYMVSAVNAGGESSLSPSDSAQTYPSAPSSVSVVTAGGTTIQVSWGSVTGTSSYEVYRSTSSGGTYSSVGTTTGLSYEDEPPTAGTTYYYKVAAVNGSGASSLSSSTSASTAPAAPEAIYAAALAEEGVTVWWERSYGATSYVVSRAADSLGPFAMVTPSSDTTFTDGGLDAGTAYFYLVEAVNGGGYSAPAGPVEVVTAPDAPPGVTAAATGTSVSMQWETVPSADTYLAYQATSSGGPYSAVDTVVDTFLTVSGLAEGTVYYYRVAASNGAVSAQSVTVSDTTSPPAPTGVVAATLSSSSISLDWLASATAAAYVLRRANSSGGPFSPLCTLEVLTSVDSLLSANQAYYYTVSALNGAGESSQSTAATATTSPAAPTGLTAQTQSSSSIALSWTASTGATSYGVYRSTGAGSYGSLVATVGGVSNTQTGLGADQTYYFRVTASSASGTSGYSSQASARTAPGVPADLAVSPVSSSTLDLSWTCSAGATSYEIYRSASESGPFTLTGSPDTCFLADTGLDDTTEYFYTVAAVGAGGTSAQCDAAPGTTYAQPALSLSTSALSTATTEGVNPSDDAFTVWNGGSGTMAFTCTKSQSWLFVAPSSGSVTGESDTVAVSYDATGLGTGVYHDTVLVVAAGALGSPESIAVSLTVSATPIPIISLSTHAVSASARVGFSPQQSKVALRNSGTGTLSYTVTSNLSWLAVAPASGSSAGEYDTLTFTYSTGALAEGVHSAAVTVTDAGATNSPDSVTVTLQLDPVPVSALTVAPSSLTVDTVEGNRPANLAIRVWNSGDTTLEYTLVPSASWIQLSATLGSAASETDTIAVTLAVEDLPAGVHTGTIIVSDESGASPDDTVTVSVKLSDAPEPMIAVSPSSRSLTTRKGSSPSATEIAVWNSGTGTLLYTVVSTASWIEVPQPTGTSIGERDTVDVSFAAASLDTGTHMGLLVIDDGAGGAVPETVTVTLRVDPVPVPTVALAPGSFSVVALTGTVAALKNLRIWNSGDTVLSYQVTSNRAWCTVNPSNGTSSGEYDTVRVRCSAASLSAGTHNARLIVADSSGTAEPETVTVAFVVISTPVPIVALSTNAIAASTVKGTSPAAVEVRVWNAGPGTLNWRATSGDSWLSVAPDSGVSAANIDTVVLTFATEALDTGDYTTGMVFADSADGSLPDTVTVNLRIDPLPAPMISLSPRVLQATAVQGSQAPDTHAVVWNSGDTVLAYAVSVDQPWCAVTPMSGTSSGERDTLRVSCDIGGLDTGEHTATVVVRDTTGIAGAETLTVSITVTVKPLPALSIAPGLIEVTAVRGTAPDSAMIILTNQAPETLRWKATASESWLSTAPATGALSMGTDTLVLRFASQALDTGLHVAQVTVSDTVASASPETVTVAIRITTAPSAVIALLPSEVVTVVKAGDALLPDTMVIANVGTTALRFVLEVDTPWVVPRRVQGAVQPGGRDTVVLDYHVDSLGTGTHRAVVSVHDTNDASVKPESLVVSLTVQGADPPRVAVNPRDQRIRLTRGAAPVSFNVLVSNAGSDTLHYRVTSDEAWLSTDTAASTVAMGVDTVIVWTTTSGLPVGAYTGNVVVKGLDSLAGVDTCVVSLTVREQVTMVFTSAPKAGDTVYTGNRVTVAWTSNGQFDHAWVELSVDSGASWRVLDDTVSLVEPFTWLVVDSTTARVRLRVHATGEDTAEVVTSGTFAIRYNHAPEITAPDTVTVVDPENTVLRFVANDPDGDSVTVYVTRLPRWATVTSRATIALAPEAGDASGTVRIIANDGRGMADTQSVLILVAVRNVYRPIHRAPSGDAILSVARNGRVLWLRYAVATEWGVSVEAYTLRGALAARLPLSRAKGVHTHRWEVGSLSGPLVLKFSEGRRVRSVTLTHW